jgi:hypothetical protein
MIRVPGNSTESKGWLADLRQSRMILTVSSEVLATDTSNLGRIRKLVMVRLLDFYLFFFGLEFLALG